MKSSVAVIGSAVANLEISQWDKVTSMDPGKLAFVQQYLEDLQDSPSMTEEVSESGLATHTTASELGTEEINGKLVMLFCCSLIQVKLIF